MQFKAVLVICSQSGLRTVWSLRSESHWPGLSKLGTAYPRGIVPKEPYEYSSSPADSEPFVYTMSGMQSNPRIPLSGMYGRAGNSVTSSYGMLKIIISLPKSA